MSPQNALLQRNVNQQQDAVSDDDRSWEDYDSDETDHSKEAKARRDMENRYGYFHYQSEFLDEKSGSSYLPEKDPDAEYSHRYAHAFPDQRPGGPTKPLISYVRNDWRYHNGKRVRSPSPDVEDLLPNWLTDIVCSRAFKRLIAGYFILMGAVFVWWFGYFGPGYVERSWVQESLKARGQGEYGFFGMNKRVEFAGMIQLRVMHTKLVPGSDVPGTNGRRLVIVGDIHGCLDERKSTL